MATIFSSWIWSVVGACTARCVACRGWVAAHEHSELREADDLTWPMDADAAKFTDGTQETRCADAYPIDIIEAARASLSAPKWYYEGEDHQVHGPYSSAEMLRWCRAGYFADSMPLRTEGEDRFHTLAEWTQYASGQSPFLTLVNTFDQLVNLSMSMHLSQLILTPPPTGPFVVMPPPTAASAPPAASLGGFSPVQAVPSFIAAYPPNPVMIPPPTIATAHQLPFSQPPSEPVDELPSSASNTPDDTDCTWIASNCVRSSGPMSTSEKCVGTEEAPWCEKRDKANDPIAHTVRHDVGVQTSMRKMRPSDAVRVLSELFGEPIEIA
ncbi:unnamed protein product [Toxocara canis]|uniref:GYF domain-containing protein n=1 Tax=Toxocara canis TaxID=6265 RepID=A0A183UQI4_TOXCA|nr:unnamed protein product [Toxocara canis]